MGGGINNALKTSKIIIKSTDYQYYVLIITCVTVIWLGLFALGLLVGL